MSVKFTESQISQCVRWLGVSPNSVLHGYNYLCDAGNECVIYGRQVAIEFSNSSVEKPDAPRVIALSFDNAISNLNRYFAGLKMQLWCCVLLLTSFALGAVGQLATASGTLLKVRLSTRSTVPHSAPLPRSPQHSTCQPGTRSDNSARCRTTPTS